MLFGVLPCVGAETFGDSLSEVAELGVTNAVMSEKLSHTIDITEVSQSAAKHDSIKPGQDTQNVLVVLIQKTLHRGHPYRLKDGESPNEPNYVIQKSSLVAAEGWAKVINVPLFHLVARPWQA